MRFSRIAGTSLALLGGYFTLKWFLRGHVADEKLLVSGVLYHWTAITILGFGWSMWLIKSKSTTRQFWGDFKLLAQPLAMYAIVASMSAWSWNYIVDNDRVDLKRAALQAELEVHTHSEQSWNEFLSIQKEAIQKEWRTKGRETYRQEVSEQIDNVNSPTRFLAIALLGYMFAALIVSLGATLLLHHIWGIASMR